MSDADEPISPRADKTIAFIYGSGVLADPDGLNREELVKLAHACNSVVNFDSSNLSKMGTLYVWRTSCHVTL